jgi:hypothetical protein
VNRDLQTSSKGTDVIVPFQFWKLIFAVFLLVTLQWAPHHDTGVVIFQFHYGAVYRAVNRSAPVLRGACTVIQRKGLGGVRCDERDGQCVEQEVDGKSGAAERVFDTFGAIEGGTLYLQTLNWFYLTQLWQHSWSRLSDLEEGPSLLRSRGHKKPQISNIPDNENVVSKN